MVGVPKTSTKKTDSGLGRANEPTLLILTSLAAGTKHGYALTKDIAEFAGVELGPGTLYGAITRLEQRGLIEPTEGDERRRPYRITADGRAALTAAVRDMRTLADEGALRLGLGVLVGRVGWRRAPMSGTPRSSSDRLLRWFPAPWRARYGDELAALMEDSFGGGPIPWRTRVSTARAGLVQRVRASGLGGDAERPADRARSGSLLVLCAWAFVVVGGAMYAKFNENWAGSTPKADRWVPQLGFVAVEAAAAAGLLVVMVAGLIVLPALIRAVVAGGWTLIRRQVLLVAGLGGATIVVGVPLVIWAHHLSEHQRNGGLGIYTALFLVVCGLAAATIAALTAAAVSLTNRLELTTSALTWLSRLALAMVGAIVVVVAGIAAWWVSLALQVPAVLGGRAPFDLVGVGVLVTAGLALAAVGGRRVLRALPRRQGGR